VAPATRPDPPPAVTRPPRDVAPPRDMDTDPAPHFRPYNLRVRKRTLVTEHAPVPWQPDAELHKRARIECIEFTHHFLTTLTSRSTYRPLRPPAPTEDGTSDSNQPDGRVPYHS
jgi:hypothetical protein